MATVNIDILGMGEFNSEDHYIYYCGQESLPRNGVAIIVNKRLWNTVIACILKYDRMISVHFQGKPLWDNSLLSEPPGKESACNVGDLGLIPGSGRSTRGGHGNPLQYSCLESPTDRGAWRATVHGVARVRHDLVTRSALVTATTTLRYTAQITAENLPDSTGNSTQCSVVTWMGRKSKKRGDIIWLIHFAGQQKLMQHCKATILE